MGGEKRDLIFKTLLFVNDKVENSKGRGELARFYYSKEKCFFSFSDQEMDENETSSDYVEIILASVDKNGVLFLTAKGEKTAGYFFKKTEKCSEPHENDYSLNFRNALCEVRKNKGCASQIFLCILNQINKPDVSEETKNEAKSKLKAFLEHPVTNCILGSSIKKINEKLKEIER